MAEKLQTLLKEVGSKLENPPANKDALIKLLKVLAPHCTQSLPTFEDFVFYVLRTMVSSGFSTCFALLF